MEKLCLYSIKIEILLSEEEEEKENKYMYNKNLGKSRSFFILSYTHKKLNLYSN
jgi:hypothetical protein